MYRFFNVGFYFPGVPKILDLEPAFRATGDDWIRYSALSWIIWTNKTAPQIYEYIRPYIDPQDQVLIAPLDFGQCFGMLSPAIWNWINSKNPPNPIATGIPMNALFRHLLEPPKG
jgi:hypothetical protein